MVSGMHNHEKDYKKTWSAEDHVRALLRHIGEDPSREGLLETPDRVVRSYQELFAGYQFVKPDGTEDGEKITSMLKMFDEECDEMVLLKGVEFTSFCEHHWLPFIGVAHVAYIPDKRVIGLSKLARIVDVYAKRLQVQERLTQQVTRCIDKYLKPKGSACVISATHSCMTCRGVMKRETKMITSSLTGAFKDEESCRSEFMSLVRG